ncbi:MAG: cob(I)yrinic acid a,c-diamide adenosyltransferase [Deferrisomatales bacterium]
MKKGCVQVYTGEGKGKTTAAMGLALRAAGAGLNVFIAQFAKRGTYSEHKSLERLSDRITVRQYGLNGFIRNGASPEDREAARRGLDEVGQAMASGHYQVIIVDEGNIAPALGLFPAEDLVHLIDARPEGVELVLTGRRAAAPVIARADLVTEMREVKHYYRSGVPAREGIER